MLIVLSLASTLGVAKDSDTKVIYNRSGNFLVSYRGPKDSLPDFSRLSALRDNAARESSAATFSYILDDWGSSSYGNGQVRAEFRTEVEYSDLFGSVFRELEGNSMTYWTGTVPQELSTEVELDDKFKFFGLSISISLPLGGRLSKSGSTVTWSGDDEDTWYLTHGYAGIRAHSLVYIGYTEQSTSGHHFFGEAHHWESAYAKSRGS